MELAALKKVTKSNEITSHLPSSLIEEILLNLPLKSLIRYRILSKEWSKQITHPTFARLYLRKHPNDFAIFYEYKLDNNCSRILVADVNEVGGGRFILNSPILGILRYRCCCDGILCFDDTSNLILLWNPLTNWYKKIPFPYNFKSKFKIPLIGFGYDSSTKDYKLVFTHSNVIEIMSLKSNSWRLGHHIFPYAHKHYIGKALHINGTFYWISSRGIISFDLATETFGKVKKPLSFRWNASCRLTALEGMLCIIQNRGKSRYEIWVMKEDSNWIRLQGLSMCWNEQVAKSMIIIMKKLTVCSHISSPRIIDYVCNLVSPLD